MTRGLKNAQVSHQNRSTVLFGCQNCLKSRIVHILDVGSFNFLKLSVAFLACVDLCSHMLTFALIY